MQSFQSATWSFRGRAGDIVSIAIGTEAPQFAPEVRLQQAESGQQVARRLEREADADMPRLESFLIPQDAHYSLTVLAPGQGGSFHVELSCAGEASLTPEPAPTLLPTAAISPASSLDLPMPEAGVGDIQISLRWASSEDLDLHVIDPRGEEISFANPKSLTGGRLEAEANGSCSLATDAPAETVFWPDGAALAGQYRIAVEYYGACGAGDPQPFEVAIWLHGELFKTVGGTLSLGEKLYVYDLEY